jgi:hypothetical protein
MSGYDEPPPVTSLSMTMEQVTVAISDMVAQQQWPMPPSLPYGMLGYGMMLLPFQDMQPMVLPFQGVHPTTLLFQGVHVTAPVPIQQIEHPMDIATEPTGKMLTHQVLAAMRLQAATRGLLARRPVREMRDLQQIKPCTPSQLLQVALRLMEDFDSVRHVGDLRYTVPLTGGGRAIFLAGGELKVYDVGGWMPSALLCVAQTSSRPAGRRHGVTGESAPRSTAAFRHRPSCGRLRWSLLRPLPSGHTHGIHGIQETVPVQV